MASETRPMRLCDSCGQVDDHPRHVLATAEGESPTSAEVQAKALQAARDNDELFAGILEQIKDTSTTVKHMDCCAADGCAVCRDVLAAAGVPEGTIGSKLQKALTSGKVDKVGAKHTDMSIVKEA